MDIFLPNNKKEKSQQEYIYAELPNYQLIHKEEDDEEELEERVATIQIT